MGGDLRAMAQSLDIYLDSTLESADGAEDAVLGVAREAGFPEEEMHKIGMAVRELVVNAVVHGNRYNTHKKVHLQVSMENNRLVTVVADQGNGFDMNAVPDPLAEENLLNQSGRGLLLVRAFMDEFQMRRLSPAGTEVKLVKYLTHGS